MISCHKVKVKLTHILQDISLAPRQFDDSRSAVEVNMTEYNQVDKINFILLQAYKAQHNNVHTWGLHENYSIKS